MRLNLTLYKTSSPTMALDKVLEAPIPLQGDLKHACSVTEPVLTIARDDNSFLIGYNYAYVAEFKRYYFMKVTLEMGGLATITLTVDPWVTFRAGIRNLTCYVERQENVYDPYFHDDAVTVAQGSIIEAIDVGSVGSTTRSIYITCVGASEEETDE